MLGGLEDSSKLGVYCTGDRGACLKGVLGELSTRLYNALVTGKCLAGVDGAGPTRLAKASVSGCSSRSRSAALTTITLGSEVVEVPVSRPSSSAERSVGEVVEVPVEVAERSVG